SIPSAPFSLHERSSDLETDHVNSVGPVGSKAGLAGRLGKLAACAASYPDVVHQVVTQYAARVGESVRVMGVRGVQENPHRFERRSEEHRSELQSHLNLV